MKMNDWTILPLHNNATTGRYNFSENVFLRLLLDNKKTPYCAQPYIDDHVLLCNNTNLHWVKILKVDGLMNATQKFTPGPPDSNFSSGSTEFFVNAPSTQPISVQTNSRLSTASNSQTLMPTNGPTSSPANNPDDTTSTSSSSPSTECVMKVQLKYKSKTYVLYTYFCSLLLFFQFLY